MPKRKQYVWGREVGLERGSGQLGMTGAASGWLGSPAAASLDTPARGAGRPHGALQGRVPAAADGTVLFPFEASPGRVPIHSSCFLICIFFCMDMASRAKPGFLLFWGGISGQTLLFQMQHQVVRFRCVPAVSFES